VVFRGEADYRAFLRRLAQGHAIAPVQVFGYCLMPNHFHLLVQPATDTALSAYMEWVTDRYACDLRRKTGTIGHGHVFQRRFWNAPVEGRLAFSSVLRYIEANPARAQLVATAEAWDWSSLSERRRNIRGVASALPHALPSNWSTFVNNPQSEGVLRDIRDSLMPKPGRPCGKRDRPPLEAASE
jgi:putative transposase